MASQEIGGLWLPRAVAGQPALELCNTLAGWGEPAPREYLATYDHLLVWAGALDLVPQEAVLRLRAEAGRDPERAADVLATARGLRADLYAALTDPEVGQPVLDRIGAAVRAAGSDVRIERTGRERLRLAHDTGSLSLPVHAFAEAARRLIDDGLVDDVGQCPGTGCGWLFLRNGRPRRWCIMSICGNRAKARRFSERRRAAATATA